MSKDYLRDDNASGGPPPMNIIVISAEDDDLDAAAPEALTSLTHLPTGDTPHEPLMSKEGGLSATKNITSRHHFTPSRKNARRTAEIMSMVSKEVDLDQCPWYVGVDFISRRVCLTFLA
jgi:hypothetical protein